MRRREHAERGGTGIHLKKRFGQHMLKDQCILARIAGECGLTGDTTVLEIGAGTGNLTEELAQRAGRVISVEMDPQFQIYHTRLMMRYNNLEFIRSDILDLDLDSMESLSKAGDLIIAGNIPYGITSPLIMKILEGNLPFRGIVFMVQKEMAERITAPPGSSDRSAFSLKVQYRADIELLFKVPASSFIPPPRVDSAVIRFTLKRDKGLEKGEEASFFRLLTAAFAQKRKTLINSLGHGLKGAMSREEVLEVLEGCGISPGCRAETLNLIQFYDMYHAMIAKNPSFLQDKEKKS